VKAAESVYPAKRFELFTGYKSEKNLCLYEKCGYRRYKQTDDLSGLVMVFLEKYTEDGGIAANGV
jgi:hypothetical protein